MAFKQEYDEEKKKYLIPFLKDYVEKRMSDSLSNLDNELFRSYINLACSLSDKSYMEKVFIWVGLNVGDYHYPNMLLDRENSIMASMNDRDIEGLWNDINYFSEKLCIVKSRKSEKMKLKLLIALYNEEMKHMIRNEDLSAEIVAQFSSSEFREFLATKVFNFSDETIKKYRLTNKAQMEYEKRSMNNISRYVDPDYVSGLNSADEKIKLLDKVLPLYRAKVVASLPPLEIYDKIKKEHIKMNGANIVSSSDSFNLVLSLSDKAKDIFLENAIKENDIESPKWSMEFDKDLARITASFHSNELKQKYRKYVKEEQNQLIVEASLGYYDDEKEPTDVIISYKQLDEPTREGLVNIVNNVREYEREQLEVDGWKNRDDMIRASEKIASLASSYEESKKEEASIIDMIRKPQISVQSTTNGERE